MSVALFEGLSDVRLHTPDSLRFIRGYMPSPAAQATSPTPFWLWLPHRIYDILRTNRLIPQYLKNGKNSQASPTPVLEGERIYVHFGAHGTACINQSGEIIWKTRLEYDNGQHGTGGSPVLYEDLLIVSCDGQDVQFVAALDKMTGKVGWKKSRQGYQAYTTPLVVRLPTGDQVISPGAYRAIACGWAHLFLSEEGLAVVIAPGKKFQALATNQLDGETLASMAVSGGSIFIRSRTHLYRLSSN